MKMMLLTAGTRGDVEPSGADTASLDTVSLRMDFAQLVSDQGVSPRAAARTFKTVIRPAVGRLLSAAVEHIVAFAPDVVVYHPKVLSAPAAAQRLGIPSVLVETVPALTPTREFPSPIIPAASLGPLNRFSYAPARAATLMFRRELQAALDLLPPGRTPAAGTRATLIPVSPHLLPRPADWPASVHLTGHWAAKPMAMEVDDELAAFLDGGDFVYAGFGSMKAGDARERGAAVIEAARRNGLRALVATGWGGIEVPTAVMGGDVLVRESVAHHMVLPRAAAAIHHGGAGTVHAVARAGIPSVVVPFIADQPFWGTVLHRRGLGPQPVPYRKLTADRLARALGEAGSCRIQAARTGELVRAEDGTAVAVGVLESLAGN